MSSPFYAHYRTIRLSLSFKAWEKLPRNAAFKYEYVGSEVVLTPRPGTMHGKLALPEWKAVTLKRPPSLRSLCDADWKVLPMLFAAAFQRDAPFSGLSDMSARKLAKECLQYTRDGGDGEVLPEACVVASEDGVVGAALVTLHGDIPHLTWIFTHPFMTRQGIGTALLQEVVLRLQELGLTVLESTFLLGNTPSTVWHWRMGFKLKPTGIRALYEAA